MVIDVIIEIASRIQNEEPSSMGDWYELPYGIKNIKIQQGKAVFYFNKNVLY
jgi:putative component of toxin-antitoxin plasmid stabilization module